MPQHVIGSLNFYFHPVQNVLLFSTHNPISSEQLEAVIREIAQNKDQYNVQDPQMPFDVLIRQNNQLLAYNFDEEGHLVLDSSPRAIDQEGLFHFQFQVTPDHIERFSVDHEEFSLEQMSNPQLNNLAKDELSVFIKTNFPKHFEQWELMNHAIDSAEVRAHAALLASASNKLYVIRDSNNALCAVVGISMTSDERLAFQSITVTRADLRQKGLMAAALQRISNDSPQALLTAYVVNPGIRESLGEAAMTKYNQANVVAAAKSNFLNTILSEREINLSQLRPGI
jgi:adenylate kinase family enzyme